jgi:hypothetical protein
MTPRGSRLACCKPIGPIGLQDIADRIIDRLSARERVLTVFVADDMVYAVSPDSTILRDLGHWQMIGSYNSRIRHNELVADIEEWRG